MSSPITGQVACVSYRDLAEGTAFERRLFGEFLDREPPDTRVDESPRRRGVLARLMAYRRAEKGLVQRFVNYLEQDVFGEHSAYERDGVRVISAGPNALLGVVDTPDPLTIEPLEPRFPGLAQAISRSPEIGFVLARSLHGPVCFWRGRRYPLGSGEPGPFRDRRDVALVIEGIMDLMAMRGTGDLVIYGIDAPEGHVSFIPGAGAHAGPSPEELHTFLVAPPAVRVPGPITRPVQLYAPFVAYQEQA